MSPAHARARQFFRNPWKIGALLLLLVGSTVSWRLIREYRVYFWPHRFYVVEPGILVRGAKQTPPMLRNILREHRIRTMVNLDDKVLERNDPNRVDADPYIEEKAIAREMGVAYRGFIWQGSGIGPYEEYDAVADILATTACRPVFVHCAAGEKRTNAAFAAYWIRHRGLTLEQVIERLRVYGLRPERKPDFMAHLKGYYDYTVHSRHTASSATISTQPSPQKDAATTSAR